MTADSTGWRGVTWNGWQDLELIRARLAAGADPNTGAYGRYQRPLHQAAERGSAEVVALLAGLVDDVDALEDGRPALWEAVFENHESSIRALLAAGADPWRPALAGWSPGRLGLAGPHADLFADLPGAQPLTDPERAAVAESRRLLAVLREAYHDGWSFACVAGIDAAEAARRLDASPVRWSVDPEADPRDGPFGLLWHDDDDDQDGGRTISATTVPGGCLLTQPWGYAAQMPRVVAELSRGTVCYGLYVNPKSGCQGSISRDGRIHGWDLHPGGWPHEDDPPEDLLHTYLYHGNAVAYSCACAGLRLEDTRAIDGPADMWIKLPVRDDYWIAEHVRSG